MPGTYDLSASEYRIMQLFWKNEKEYTLAEAVECCQAMDMNRKISSKTIQTFLIRMVKKGALKTRKEGHRAYYSCSCTQEEYAQKWMGKFIDEAFDGSLRNMMLAISGGVPRLTPEQKKELEDFWNE